MEPTRYGIEGNAFVIRDATIGDIPDLCKLTYQQFKRENLEAIGHTFSMATSYAKYESAIQSKFFEILVAIVDCNLTGAILWRAILTRAILSGANLTGATFAGADLTDATLAGCDFTGATLTGAKFSDE